MGHFPGANNAPYGQKRAKQERNSLPFQPVLRSDPEFHFVTGRWKGSPACSAVILKTPAASGTITTRSPISRRNKSAAVRRGRPSGQSGIGRLGNLAESWNGSCVSLAQISKRFAGPGSAGKTRPTEATPSSDPRARATSTRRPRSQALSEALTEPFRFSRAKLPSST